MSVQSWHDSDDIDSDIECEAYSMLYYNPKITQIPAKPAEIKDLESLKMTQKQIDSDKIDTKNNIDESIIVLSDSDESFVAKKIVCNNKINSLSIGANSSTSSDSENEEINKFTKKVNNSIILNVRNENRCEIVDYKGRMSELEADWSVDNIETPQKPKYNRSRYFESSNNNNGGVCEVCLKKGHSGAECTRTGPVCILCGKEGHISNKCEDLVCYVCFRTDHWAKKCPQTALFHKQSCKRCGQRGHSEQICPDIWRQYKYTLSPGQPVIQSCSSQNKYNVYCANCSRVGHFTETCSRSRMSSRFIGPPPIMEIIRFDKKDVYKSHNLTYTTPLNNNNNNENDNDNDDNSSDIDPIIKNINVTEILTDESKNAFDIETKNCDFGDGYIMLSPIVNNKTTKKDEEGGEERRKSLVQINRPFLQCSTPSSFQTQNNNKITLTENNNNNNNNKDNKDKVNQLRMPILPETLLKKLFPQETSNVEKLSPSLRAKLRKKLKLFIKNGYLPGDSQMTQDRMDFWLQEISTGRSLSYKEKKKLLGSVSAALHSISDRVSDTSLSQQTATMSMVTDLTEENIDIVTNVPESRRKMNKSIRQQKSLENELRQLRKENSTTTPTATTRRLRNSASVIDLTLDEDKPPSRKRRKRNNCAAAGKSAKTPIDKSAQSIIYF